MITFLESFRNNNDILINTILDAYISINEARLSAPQLEYYKKRYNTNQTSITDELKEAHIKLIGTEVDGRIVIPLQLAESDDINDSQAQSVYSPIEELKQKINTALNDISITFLNKYEVYDKIKHLDQDLIDNLDELLTDLTFDNYETQRSIIIKFCKEHMNNISMDLINDLKPVDKLFKQSKINRSSKLKKSYNVVISNTIEDVVLQSEGRYWHDVSCKNFSKDQSQYIEGEIGVVAIAYLVSGEPQYDNNELVDPIGRMLLIPTLYPNNDELEIKFLPLRVYHDGNGKQSLPPIIFKSFISTVNAYLDSKNLLTNDHHNIIMPNAVYDDVSLATKHSTTSIPLKEFKPFKAENFVDNFRHFKEVKSNFTQDLNLNMLIDDEKINDYIKMMQFCIKYHEKISDSLDYSLGTLTMTLMLTVYEETHALAHELYELLKFYTNVPSKQSVINIIEQKMDKTKLKEHAYNM